MGRGWVGVALGVLGGGGAGCKQAPEAEAPAGPVRFEEVERIVTVGDNLGSNPSAATSYLALLQRNDDALFPAFAGRDLATILPDAEVIRLDRGGDSYGALAASEAPIALCGGGDPALPCVDPADERPALVIVGLGMNDLVAAALRLVSDPALRDDPASMIDAFGADVATVLAAAADPFARPPLVVVCNAYDPSDDVGDLADLVTGFFPVEGAEEVTPELALRVLRGYDEAIVAAAEAAGADLVDLRSHFLGHALHYDDPANAHYDADDPTLWLSTVVDPNLRGAHEIRRVLWEALTGEGIAEVPSDLPIPVPDGIPAVGAAGWGKAVADEAITVELVDEAGTIYPNVAGAADEALGPPDGGLVGGTVAVGTVGAYLVVDLGEDTAATDGEGEDLVVLEFGAASGGTPEPYRVSVSEAAEGPWTHVADGFGERAFDLGEVGVAAARFVRIDSLAQPADVLGGLGSPYYPGPEIDAVGAVYPGTP